MKSFFILLLMLSEPLFAAWPTDGGAFVTGSYGTFEEGFHDGIDIPGIGGITKCLAISMRGGLGGARSGSGDGVGGMWSAGAGIRLFDVNVDYALAPYRDLGSTHRVTLKKKF